MVWPGSDKEATGPTEHMWGPELIMPDSSKVVGLLN